VSATGRPQREHRGAKQDDGPVSVAAAAIGARQRVGIDALPSYPDRIDVRTPSEFAVDHVPGALNRPVLSDDERARVGTLHAQVSAFEAKKVGAALISRNIAAIVESFADRPRDWAPLVYCWRGGQRSRSLAHVMNEIGWRAVQLEGGYRAWRRHVVEALQHEPARFDYRVVCGLTGSGKSRLIAALAQEGAQVLDLEGLARHRGSLLGDLPDDPQPSQKAFESALLDALSRLDPARPVFVESESRKIGRVQVPESLLDRMRASPCVRVELATPLRIALLKEEYAHFLADPAALSARLAPLLPLLGKATIDRWNAAGAAGEFDELVGELLEQHYDPTYSRSIERNFPRHVDAIVGRPAGISADDFLALARELIGGAGAHRERSTRP
jgi:tRNA 2-selenouridine synthase